jgi:hypothetical protein
VHGDALPAVPLGVPGFLFSCQKDFRLTYRERTALEQSLQVLETLLERFQRTKRVGT